MSYENIHMREIGDDYKYLVEHILQFLLGCIVIVGVLALAVYGLVRLFI